VVNAQIAALSSTTPTTTATAATAVRRAVVVGTVALPLGTQACPSGW
jgi:hypothetical protein